MSFSIQKDGVINNSNSGLTNVLPIVNINNSVKYIGALVFNRVDEKLYYCDGVNWKKLLIDNASLDSTFITMTLNNNLTNERVLTGSSNILVTDNGPNNNVILDITNTNVNPSTYQLPTNLIVDSKGRITGVTGVTFTQGAYTPILSAGGNPLGSTYTRQNGYYSVVGNKVTVTINLVVQTLSSSTGNLTINLPITSGSSGPFKSVMYINPAVIGSSRVLYSNINSNANVASIIAVDTANPLNAPVTQTHTLIVTLTEISGTLEYFI